MLCNVTRKLLEDHKYTATQGQEGGGGGRGWGVVEEAEDEYGGAVGAGLASCAEGVAGEDE